MVCIRGADIHILWFSARGSRRIMRCKSYSDGKVDFVEFCIRSRSLLAS